MHGERVRRQILRTGSRVDLGEWTFTFSREEYADHGRPYGGRIGGELGHQRPQPATPRRQARLLSTHPTAPAHPSGGRVRTTCMKPVLPALKYAAAGVLATLAGMSAGHLVAAALNPASSPVLAVGSTVIDLTPTPMKEWAVREFGTKDKPILIGSVMLVTLLDDRRRGRDRPPSFRRRAPPSWGCWSPSPACWRCCGPSPWPPTSIPALAAAVVGVAVLAAAGARDAPLGRAARARRSTARLPTEDLGGHGSGRGPRAAARPPTRRPLRRRQGPPPPVRHRPGARGT